MAVYEAAFAEEPPRVASTTIHSLTPLSCGSTRVVAVTGTKCGRVVSFSTDASLSPGTRLFPLPYTVPSLSPGTHLLPSLTPSLANLDPALPLSDPD